MIECPDCVRSFGSRCSNQDACFSGGGCDYKLPADTIRDDLMDSGFVPKHYKSPITIKITDIVGVEFQRSNVCPMANNASGQTTSQFVRASSFQTNLFITLTEMTTLSAEVVSVPGTNTSVAGVPVTCLVDTRSKCINGECNNGELCISGWCQCKTGYCYDQTAFTCIGKGTASPAPLQADLSWGPIAVLLMCLLVFRRFF